MGDDEAEHDGEDGDDSAVVVSPPSSCLNTPLELPPQQDVGGEVYEDQHQQRNCLHYKGHQGHHLNFSIMKIQG